MFAKIITKKYSKYKKKLFKISKELKFIFD